MRSLFDQTICFQNSCDQDYNIESYKGIPLFETVVKEWQNKSDDEVYEKHAMSCCSYSKETFMPKWVEYYRRTYIYEEIESMLSNYLFDNNSTLDISLLPQNQYIDIDRFLHLCYTMYINWTKQFIKKEGYKK